MDSLQQLQSDLIRQVTAAADLAQLEGLRVAALGKKGEITQHMKALGGLPPDERKAMGQALNDVKTALSTAIEAREKPEKKAAPVEKTPKKRGRPKKGEQRPKEPTRLERQAAGQPLGEMIAELPTTCNVGTRKTARAIRRVGQGTNSISMQLMGAFP